MDKHHEVDAVLNHRRAATAMTAQQGYIQRQVVMLPTV